MCNACSAEKHACPCRSRSRSVPATELRALRRYTRFDAEHHDQDTRYILAEDLERLLGAEEVDRV